MYARIQQLALWLLFLFVFYLVLVRVLISAVQFFPEKMAGLAQSVSGAQISFQNLSLSQSWFGFDVKLSDLQVESESLSLKVNYLESDFNLLSPIFPQLPYGQKLVLSGVSSVVRANSSPETQPTSTTGDMEKIGWSMSQIWQVIKLESIDFQYQAAQSYQFTIAHFSSFSGIKWSFGGDLSGAQDGQQVAKLQLTGNLADTGEGRYDGTIKIASQEPVLISKVKHWLPSRWVGSVPDGELAGEVKAKVVASELADLELNLSAQGLLWPEVNANNPKSIGLSMSWLDVAALSGYAKGDWVFRIEQVRFDNHYLETASPIILGFKSQHFVTLSAQKVDYRLFKPFVDAYYDFEFIEQVNLASLELQAQDVEFAFDLNSLKVVAGQAQINKLSVAESNELPGLNLANVKLVKTAEQYIARFNAPQEILFSQYQAKPISVGIDSELAVSVMQDGEWLLNPLHFNINQIPVDLSAKGTLNGFVSLVLSASWADMAALKAALPYYLMGEDLSRFLKEGLKSGENIQANLTVNGNVFDPDFFQSETALVLEASLEQAALKFDAQWPVLEGLDAKLKFTPFNLSIAANSGRLGELLVQDINAVISDLDDDQKVALVVSASTEVEATAAKSFLLNTPIASLVGITTFLDKQLAVKQGTAHVTLSRLHIPFSADEDISVAGLVNFKGWQAVLFDALAVDSINGDLAFSEKGVNAKSLKGRYLSGPVTTQISTDEKRHTISINSEGQVHFDDEFADGDIPWSSQVVLGQAKGIEVATEFNLKTVVSRLPAPFSESAMAEQRPSKVKVNALLGEENMQLDVSLGDMGSISGLQPWEDGIGHWIVDLGLESTAPVVASGAEGSRVSVSLAALDIDEWQHYLTILDERLGLFNSSEKGSSIFWQDSRVAFKQVKLFGHYYQNVALGWRSLSAVDNALLSFDLQGDGINAHAEQLTPERVNLRVEELVLKLPQVKNNNEGTAAEANAKLLCQDKQPIILPNNTVVFEGKNIRINDTALKQISFEAELTEDKLSVNKLSAKYGEFGEASGQYQYVQATNQSDLLVTLDSTRAEDIVELLAIKKGVTGKQAHVELGLNWQGGYQCFATIKAKGHLHFDVKKGEIKDAEPGFARLIGLLSIESLARRIKLDVKDVTATGLVFDQLDGRGKFRKGIFGLEDLRLKSPAASAWVFGEVNLVEMKLNLNAEIVPSIGSTLPAIAAISGVATPLAGLAAYALMKVVPAINEDLVTYRYEVNGSVAEPVIKDKGLNLDLLNLQTPQQNNVLENE